MSNSMEWSIRKAVKEDMGQVASLIKALAEYEKEGDEAELTSEDLIKDGFGDRAAFECLVAEEKGDVQGMAIFYPRYSTWKGRTLYLEDLVVKESERGKGLGKALFMALIEVCRKEGYRRLEWQVLDWNEPAIKFYEALGSQFDSSWLNGRITFPE
jgi:GNAT superfamily N-acetyltransferase